MDEDTFCKIIAAKGREHWRDMPWRADTRPYYVLVSELMLQQTQVSRVVPKFESFVARFPDERTLAIASLSDVLGLWQGLGYNRRAKYLHDAAKVIVSEYSDRWPQDYSNLTRLPGVGKNTAGAIRAYAFNQPSLFVETNIRTVYLHHFFANHSEVSDEQIIKKLAATIDTDNPRRFYQALMDYGSWLKANGVQNISRSRHYKKQSKLDGSLRQMRGEIIRRLSTGQANWREDIEHDERFQLALDGLMSHGLIERVSGDYRLTR